MATRQARWKPSFLLNRIRDRAAGLRSEMMTLPAFVTAGRLARFLGCSKTPVLEWIRRGNLPARRRGRYWLIRREDVFRVFDAAEWVRQYRPRPRPPFWKLHRVERRLNKLAGKRYPLPVFAKLCGCSPATIRRAVKAGLLKEQRPTPFRCWIRRWPATKVWLSSSRPAPFWEKSY